MDGSTLLGKNQQGVHQLAEIAELLAMIDLDITHIKRAYYMIDMDKVSLTVAQLSVKQAYSSIVCMIDRNSE